MRKERAEALGLKWLAELGPHGISAGPASTISEQPAHAAAIACTKAGISAADLDLIEINEAFAAVPIASTRLLGLDLARVNVDGGAVAESEAGRNWGRGEVR